MPAQRGESIAAALTAADVRCLRKTQSGEGRGLFCGMGVCQECTVVVDGELCRACMTEVTREHHISRGPALQSSLIERSALPFGVGDISVMTPDVLVVGGGAGGLSAAAAAAEAGAEVVLVDERARLGGQYFKQAAGGTSVRDDAQFAAGRKLIARATRAGARMLDHVEVWGAFAPRDVATLDSRGCTIWRPGQLVLATGAYERGLPVPGWTLPGVMTTGAAQTLLRSYGVVPGRRVLLAGNGPLNFQVALELARHGADVAAVAELAPQPGVWAIPALWGMASTTPGLLCDGLTLVRELHRRRIPVLYGHAVRGIGGDAESLSVRLGNGRDYRDPGMAFDVDAVCMSYGFLPANELARGLDCRHTYDHAHHSLITERSDDCETSVDGVFAVGDCCGFGGARAAMEEGLIAGTAAAAASGHAIPTALLAECTSARRRLRRHRRFQNELWRLFRAPQLHLELATPGTLICRCESVALAQIEAALTDGRPSLSEVKRRTRLGMGGCQGRTCAPLAAALLMERQGRPLNEMAFFAPRMPVKPVHIGVLSRR